MNKNINTKADETEGFKPKYFIENECCGPQTRGEFFCHCFESVEDLNLWVQDVVPCDGVDSLVVYRLGENGLERIYEKPVRMEKEVVETRTITSYGFEFTEE